MEKKKINFNTFCIVPSHISYKNIFTVNVRGNTQNVLDEMYWSSAMTFWKKKKREEDYWLNSINRKEMKWTLTLIWLEACEIPMMIFLWNSYFCCHYSFYSSVTINLTFRLAIFRPSILYFLFLFFLSTSFKKIKL